MLLYRVTCTTHITLTDHPKQPEVSYLAQRHNCVTGRAQTRNIYNHYATQIIFKAHFTLHISSLPEEHVHVAHRRFSNTVKWCPCGNLRTPQLHHGNQWAQPVLWFTGDVLKTLNTNTHLVKRFHYHAWESGECARSSPFQLVELSLARRQMMLRDWMGGPRCKMVKANKDVSKPSQL